MTMTTTTPSPLQTEIQADAQRIAAEEPALVPGFEEGFASGWAAAIETITPLHDQVRQAQDERWINLLANAAELNRGNITTQEFRRRTGSR